MDFNYLYAAQFMVQAGTAVHQYNRAEYQAQQQRQEAYRQVALNNKLAYNAHLNLNQQQVLELKKFGLDDFELKKSIRREKAKSAAMQASAGGIFGKQGTSYQAVQNNIARYGYTALVRKDVNFQTKMQNFETRHKNITLNTLSQNNAAFSNLSTGGSLIGTALSIAGTGAQTAINAKIGTIAETRGQWTRGF